MKTLLFEGPRFPRSCDPDWGMRDESGYVKPEYWKIRGLRTDIVLSDDFHEYSLTDEQKQLIKDGFGPSKES